MDKLARVRVRVMAWMLKQAAAEGLVPPPQTPLGPPRPLPTGRGYPNGQPVTVWKRYPNGAPRSIAKSGEQFDKNLSPSGALQANRPDRIQKEEVLNFLRRKYLSR